MAVPRHHLSKGRQGRRRSHLALKPLTVRACSHCGQSTRTHQVCAHCGWYKGRLVIDTVARKLAKQEKKRQQHSTP